jgi:hypothetical protein
MRKENSDAFSPEGHGSSEEGVGRKRSFFYQRMMQMVASNIPVERMDEEMVTSVLEIVSRYMNIPDSLLEKGDLIFSHILETMEQKKREKRNTCVSEIVRPTLDDLFANNVFRLERKGSIYWVPMWHHELVFDSEGTSLVVRCEPVVPAHVRMDENNDIYVRVEWPFSVELMDDAVAITFELGTRLVEIPRRQILLKREQWVVLKGQGISRINERNWYNVDERGDVHVYLVFV